MFFFVIPPEKVKESHNINIKWSFWGNITPKNIPNVMSRKYLGKANDLILIFVLHKKLIISSVSNCQFAQLTCTGCIFFRIGDSKQLSKCLSVCHKVRVFQIIDLLIIRSFIDRIGFITKWRYFWTMFCQYIDRQKLDTTNPENKTRHDKSKPSKS